MNDTKYSPATSETEEFMDGSFRSVVSYIALLAKSWKLNPSTIYALQYVTASPVEKLYTFTLSPEVCKEFGKVVEWLRERYVKRRFKSLEILETCL